MMTREEAKKVFLDRGYIEVEGGTIFDANKWREACAVISKWLEQEPCDDAVSREAAKAVVKKHFGQSIPWTAQPINEDLDALPPATPAIIHCKECKFYKTEFCKMDLHHKDMTIYVAKPDDYCSYAESEGKNDRIQL